jgi:hypothetical protein
VRRLAIPLAAILVAITAWTGIATALAGSDTPPRNDAPAYPRHGSPPPASDSTGPRVDAEVQLEPPPPSPEPAYIPVLAPVAPSKPKPAATATTRQQDAPATETTTGARKEATPALKRTPTPAPEPRRGERREWRRDRD